MRPRPGRPRPWAREPESKRSPSGCRAFQEWAAPIICAAMYMGTSAHGNLPATASPSVTAGLMWAPLTPATVNSATNTAVPHPNVIAIQPAPSPLVPSRTTFATTPLPRRRRRVVPMSSARNRDMI